MQIPAGKRRVSFVGDSFTAGHGIKNVDDRFPNLIRQAHPEWDVHILAKLGWDTGDEVEFMRKTLSDGYQLDVVVLVYCMNDVSDMMPEVKTMLKEIDAEAKHESWLVRKSYFINLLYYRFKTSHNPFTTHYYNFVSKGYREPLWTKQKERLTEFRDLVQSHNGRLLVVTFPFLHALGPNYDLQFAHVELDRFWQQLDVPHLDLLPAFSDIPPGKLIVNRFDPHPNEFASRIAAREIDRFIKTEMSRPATNP
jgi:lysophospholipase L1-like esterase